MLFLLSHPFAHFTSLWVIYWMNVSIMILRLIESIDALIYYLLFGFFPILLFLCLSLISVSLFLLVLLFFLFHWELPFLLDLIKLHCLEPVVAHVDELHFALRDLELQTLFNVLMRWCLLQGLWGGINKISRKFLHIFVQCCDCIHFRELLIDHGLSV